MNDTSRKDFDWPISQWIYMIFACLFGVVGWLFMAIYTIDHSQSPIILLVAVVFGLLFALFGTAYVMKATEVKSQ